MVAAALRTLLIGSLALLALATSARAGSPHADEPKPLVIGHRGAAGYLPDHTLESYALAIELGADYIEPDLVATKDGHLIARHEPNLKDTTDVATKFADRFRTGVLVDGVAEDGWFASDFTLAEIKTLRAVQPLAERPQQFNRKFQIPTLEEVIALAKRKSKEKGRTIGIYPETKHPTYHKSIGLALEGRLVQILKRAGWNDKKAPVIIQSFEQSNLKELRAMTDVRLIQLVDANDVNTDGSLDFTAPFDRPYDWTVSGDPTLLARHFDFFVTDAGLREVKGLRRRDRPLEALHRLHRGLEGQRRRLRRRRERRREGQRDGLGAAAAIRRHPARPRPRAARAHVDVPQRAAPARPRLRRRSRERVRAVLRAGRRRRLLGLRGHGRGRANPVPARERCRVRALLHRRSARPRA